MVIVAIEGIDGSGKTTQAKMLVKRLKEIGYDALYIRPVYLLVDFLKIWRNNRDKQQTIMFSPRKMRVNESRGIAKLAKIYLLGIMGYLYSLLTYAFLKIRPKFRGKVIVCDRYFYQFFFDLFGESGVKVSKYIPKPDIVFYLYGNLDTLRSRMDNFDSSIDQEYYKNILFLYELVAKRDGFVRIDASLDAKVINNRILGEVLKYLGGPNVG